MTKAKATAVSEFWPKAPHWCFTDEVRMTPDEFYALAENDPHGFGRPYERTKWKIRVGNRDVWHAVERQYQFGQPVYFAQKIIIQLESPT